SLARSQVIGMWRLQGFAWFFLLGGLLGYVLSFSSGTGRIFGAIITGAIAGSIYMLTQKSSRQRKILKFCQEKYGYGPYTCEIEMTESALVVNQMGMQIARDWTTVKDVESTKDSVDIVLNDSVVVVRNRAFQSPDERERFISLTRQYIERSTPARAQNATR